MANSSTVQFVIPKEPGTQTYHVILPSCGSWESRLPESSTILRLLIVHREEIEQIDLHVFRDARANGVAACNYAVIRQASGTSQGLIAARSRLSKQGLTIPRLELVAGHMAVNLADNVRCSGQASCKKYTLLAGQFGSLILDLRARSL